MTLHLTKPALDGIRAHGERGYPDEICGLLLGSVAEAVMRHAACPVLVVRAEE